MRLHLDSADVARTRVTTSWGPLAETVLSLGLLRDGRDDRAYGLWRSSSRDVVGTRAAQLARYLHPMPGLVVDLMTLIGHARSFEDGCRSLLSLEPQRVRHELSAYSLEHLPTWLRGLEGGTVDARRTLAGVLAQVHAATVAPYWPAMLDHLAAERARLARLLAESGVEGLLAGTHPGLSWHDAVVEIPSAAPWTAEALDADLGGRGLVVVPSVFHRGGPTPYFPVDGGPVLLLVPALSDPDAARKLWRGRTLDRAALGRLIGGTRARVLRVVADGGLVGATTGEVARRLDVAVSSASEHLAALRGAGLLASRRDRNSVVHTVTPLGVRLLGYDDAARVARSQPMRNSVVASRPG